MPRAAKLASPLSALTSAALHAALLAAGVAATAQTKADAARLAPDAWATRSVEVGTVPDAAPPSIAAAPAPGAEPKPAAEAESAPASSPIRVRSALTPPRPRASRPTGGGHSTPSAAAAPAPTASTISDSAGSLGSVGLPPGVRHLATAFTRALPAGGYRDAAWSELPLGNVGNASIALSVSESGTLEEVEVEPERGLPPVLARMIDRTVLMLKSGTFSLDSRKVRGGGTERLELEVTLSTRPANEDDLAAPAGLFAQSFAPPQLDRAGYARFTLNSGRHIEALVRFAKDRAPVQ